MAMVVGTIMEVRGSQLVHDRPVLHHGSPRRTFTKENKRQNALVFLHFVQTSNKNVQTFVGLKINPKRPVQNQEKPGADNYTNVSGNVLLGGCVDLFILYTHTHKKKDNAGATPSLL